MRPQILNVVLVLCTLLLVVHAWTKEDHEIFRLRDELEAAEGEGVTFYDFVGVKPSASVEEIRKAFKKKSNTLHPDKARHNFVASKSTRPPRKAGEKRKPGVHVSKGPSQREVDKFVKQATERYQRLGVVAGLLRGPQREKYDHFLHHGFPKWRGTGYYYSRYRPGLGTVLIGLFLAGGGAAHYGALIISYNRQREFMDRYIRSARKQAWGDESGVRGIPGVNGPVATPTPPQEDSEADQAGPMNRRQKRELERRNKKEKSKPSSTKTAGRVLGTGAETEYGAPSTQPVGPRRRVQAENGKTLVVDSIGNVFLEEEDEDGVTQEYPLDPDEIARPTIWDTAVVKLPIWAYRRAFDPFLGNKNQGISLSELDKVNHDSENVDIKISTEVEEDKKPSLLQDLSASIDGFEMVDSTGIETDVQGGAARKRGKKGKK